MFSHQYVLGSYCYLQNEREFSTVFNDSWYQITTGTVPFIVQIAVCISEGLHECISISVCRLFVCMSMYQCMFTCWYVFAFLHVYTSKHAYEIMDAC